MAPCKSEKVHNTIPRHIRQLFGPPPVVLSESKALYYRLMAGFAECIKPRDMIAWLIIKDLVDAQVEITRYRRYKSQIISQTRHDEIEENLDEWKKWTKEAPERLLADAEKKKGLEKLFIKDPAELEQFKLEIDRIAASNVKKVKAEARRQVRIWRNAHSDEGHLAALLPNWIEGANQLDKLLVTAEARRASARRELDHHLNTSARMAWDVIADAEIVETTSPNQGETGGRSDAVKALAVIKSSRTHTAPGGDYDLRKKTSR